MPTSFDSEYLLAANSDARAFVVHMAGLVYALRNQYRMPVHERHLIALESLQVKKLPLFGVYVRGK